MVALLSLNTFSLFSLNSMLNGLPELSHSNVLGISGNCSAMASTGGGEEQNMGNSKAYVAVFPTFEQLIYWQSSSSTGFSFWLIEKETTWIERNLIKHKHQIPIYSSLASLSGKTNY